MVTSFKKHHNRNAIQGESLLNKLVEKLNKLRDYINEPSSSLPLVIEFNHLPINPFAEDLRSFEYSFDYIYESKRNKLCIESLFQGEGLKTMIAHRQLAIRHREIVEMRKKFDENKFFSDIAIEADKLVSKLEKALDLNISQLESGGGKSNI